MNRRAVLAIILAAGLGLAGLAPQARSADPRYGVCRQQISDYVAHRLGQTIINIDVQSYAEHMPARGFFDAGSALVYVKECSGFHAFEIRATENRCEHLPHYGKTSGSYIRYEGAFEGCRTG